MSESAKIVSVSVFVNYAEEVEGQTYAAAGPLMMMSLTDSGSQLVTSSDHFGNKIPLKKINLSIWENIE